MTGLGELVLIGIVGLVSFGGLGGMWMRIRAQAMQAAQDLLQERVEEALPDEVKDLANQVQGAREQVQSARDVLRDPLRER